MKISVLSPWLIPSKFINFTSKLLPMNQKLSALIKKPTKQLILIVASVWFVSTALLVTTITNGFRENMLQAKNFVPLLIIFCTTTIIFNLAQKYNANNPTT